MPLIDPSTKPGWVRVLPDLPLNFRFKNTIEPTTPSRRGVAPQFGSRKSPQPAPVEISFGQAPICDSKCADCKKSENAERPKRGEKPPIAPRPDRLKKAKPTAVGDSDSNKQLGEPPKKKVYPPIAPKPSIIGKPTPTLANILRPPGPSQPGMLRPLGPPQPAMLRPPAAQQFNTFGPRAPAPPRSSSFPPPPSQRPASTIIPLPEHPGLYRVPFSPHTPARDEEAYDQYMQTRGRSEGDGEMMMPEALSPSFRMRLNPTLPNDNYFGTIKIHNVTSSANFDQVIKSMEKALVLFYHPSSESSICVGREFSEASETPHPNDHAFAAVDCSQNQDLCAREDATRLPILKLYSNGFDLSTVRDVKKFCSARMHILMRMTPVLTQSRENMGAAARR